MPLSLSLSLASERECECDGLYSKCVLSVRTEKAARKGNLRHSQISFFAHLISCFLLLIFCSMTKINMQAFRNVLFLPARAPRIVVLIYLVRSFVLRVPFAESLFCLICCCFLCSRWLLFFIFSSVFLSYVARDKSFSMNFAWHNAIVERISKHT